MSAGAFIVRSFQFLADGPPRDGQVQADPTQGFAVETKHLRFMGRGVLRILTENFAFDSDVALL